jgi:hypothetical protein
MNRASNLDTVAPDDGVSESLKVNEKSEEKIAKKEEKKSVESSGPVDPKLRQKVYDILGHTKHSLSAFLVRPHVFSFQEKDDGEEILLAMRPHWITNVGWILITIAMVLGPTLLRSFALLNGLPVKYQILGVMFWYMVTFAYAFEKFLSWYFDVYIITDERVIDIDFNNLLDKKFSEAKLSMIQDVTSRQIGVAQTMFNYGQVLIQTAAEINELHFDKIPNPEKVVKVLQLMREEEDIEAIEGRTK